MSDKVGSKVIPVAYCKNSDKVLTDPSTITFSVREPDGTKTVYIYDDGPEVVRLSEGVYSMDIILDSAGNWICKIATTGAVHKVDDVRFKAVESLYDK